MNSRPTSAVVTLGGSEVATDLWGVDVMVAGTQKCLSCPSGLAPITYNARAEAVLEKRASRIRSNYLDLLQLQRYWSPARYNHHTAPTSMVFGLREALRAIVEEGLDARFERHRLHGAALRAGLAAMGLSLFGPESDEPMMPAQRRVRSASRRRVVPRSRSIAGCGGSFGSGLFAAPTGGAPGTGLGAVPGDGAAGVGAPGAAGADVPTTGAAAGFAGGFGFTVRNFALGLAKW